MPTLPQIFIDKIMKSLFTNIHVYMLNYFCFLLEFRDCNCDILIVQRNYFQIFVQQIFLFLILATKQSKIALGIESYQFVPRNYFQIFVQWNLLFLIFAAKPSKKPQGQSEVKNTRPAQKYTHLRVEGQSEADNTRSPQRYTHLRVHKARRNIHRNKFIGRI